MSTAELIAFREDLNKAKMVAASDVNKLRQRIDDITTILRERGGNKFEITDHAVVRYLQRIRGMDMDEVRAAISAELEAVADRVKVKGDAVGVPVGEHVYVLTRGNVVVTMYPAKPWEKLLPSIEEPTP